MAVLLHGGKWCKNEIAAIHYSAHLSASTISIYFVINGDYHPVTIFDDSTKVRDPVRSMDGIGKLSLYMYISNPLTVRPYENMNAEGKATEREYGANDNYKPIIDKLCEVYSYKIPSRYRPIYFFSNLHTLFYMLKK